MNVFEVEVSKLIPYEKNPRHISEEAVEMVAKSISEFGFKVPIVIDKNYVIVAGHTRLKAARLLNLDAVPCIMADDLTEKEIKAFRLVDNKVFGFSSWDNVKLAEEIQKLIESGYDITAFGFLADEYDDEMIQLRGANGELDLDSFGNDTFECECPNCGFRFNEKGE